MASAEYIYIISMTAIGIVGVLWLGDRAKEMMDEDDE